MRKTSFLILLVGLFHVASSQRQPTRVEKIDTSSIFSSEGEPAVDLTLKKGDTLYSQNDPPYQVYSLSVFNNTDSTICILGPPLLDRGLKNSLFVLGAFVDCLSNNLQYYSLQFGEGWDEVNDPPPPTPILLSPNTSLNMQFAIRMGANNPTDFHLHYASLDIKYSEIMNAYKNNGEGWYHFLRLKCKRTGLPK